MIFYIFLLLFATTALSSPQWVDHHLSEGIHRRPNGKSGALYFAFTKPLSNSSQELRTNLLWLIDPCGDRQNKIKLINESVVCDNGYIKESIGNANIVNEICSLRKNFSTEFRPAKDYFDLYYVREERCTCSHKCSDGSLIEKSPMCICSANRVMNHELVCDFENWQACNWQFGGVGFNVSLRIPRRRFALAYAKVDEPNHPATILSPYYAQFSASCTLSFLYNLAGSNEAEIRVYLEWRKYPAQSAMDNDVLLSRINKYQENSGVLDFHELKIGFVTKHARIRIECTTNVSGKKSLCKFNNISFSNCGENSEIKSQCYGQNNPTLCKKDGRMQCLADVTCDGIADCPSGEDELNCDYVERTGSKCNYNNATNLLCGWEEGTMPAVRDDQRMYIVGRLNKNLVVEDLGGHLLDGNVMRNLPRNDSGNFLLISAVRRDFYSGEYFLQSPLFPPTRQYTGDRTRPEAICTFRFKYCIKGDEQKFRVELERRAHIAKNGRWNFLKIWEPSMSNMAEHELGALCNWQQASVPIERQIFPFRLRFKINLMSRYRMPFIAVDDVSLHPNCFDSNSHTSVRHNHTFQTCGKTGADVPTRDDCKREALIGGRAELEHYPNGSRIFTVPSDGIYWVKICGAAGGGFPLMDGVKGNCIVASYLTLEEGQRLRLVIGQKGASPCDDLPKNLSPQQEVVYKHVCSTDPSIFNATFNEDIDPTLFIGAGGGGLSALWLHNGAIGIVAGGGGGAFPSILKANVRNRALASKNGNGLSLKSGRIAEDCDAECLDASPKNIADQGNCFKKVPFDSRGGFGGGGRSCGSGGGGGGGYFGGQYGRFSFGTSGSNFVNDDIFAGGVGVNNAANPEDGEMMIVKCTLTCKFPMFCTFISNSEPTMACACAPEKVLLDNHCVPPVVSKTSIWKEIPFFWLSIALAVLIMMLVIVFTISCCIRTHRKGLCWKAFARQKHLSIYENQRVDDGMELLELNQPESLEKLFSNQSFIKNLPIKNCLMLLNRIDDNDLELRQQIGQGAFGNVTMGVLRTDGQEREVAVKVLNTSWSSSETESLTRNFITEALLMSLSNNVGKATIQLIGVCLDRRPYKIVMELMKGGNLLNFLRESRPNDDNDNPNDLSLIDLIQFAKDIVEGCLILEKNQHLHRDLAARNCLLTVPGPGRRVKIGDFGLATELFDTGEYISRVRHRPIPMKWMPPEAIRDGIFSSKTDVWSFGVVCWEIFTIGQVPYTNVPSDYLFDLLASGKRLARPKGCPDEIYNGLMLECWQPHPEDRPSFAELDVTLTKLITSGRFSGLDIPLVRGKSLDKVSSPVAETPVFADEIGTPLTIDTLLPTPLGTDDHWNTSEKTPLVDVSSTRTDSEPNSTRSVKTSSTKSTLGSVPQSSSVASTPTKPPYSSPFTNSSTGTIYGSSFPVRSSSGPSTPLTCSAPWPLVKALPNIFEHSRTFSNSSGGYENVVQLNNRFKIKNYSYWRDSSANSPKHEYHGYQKARQSCSLSNGHRNPERPTQLPLKGTLTNNKPIS